MRGKYTEGQYLSLFLKDTGWNLSKGMDGIYIREE